MESLNLFVGQTSENLQLTVVQDIQARQRCMCDDDGLLTCTTVGFRFEPLRIDLYNIFFLLFLNRFVQFLFSLFVLFELRLSSESVRAPRRPPQYTHTHMSTQGHSCKR
jgi:hypothetical protein